MAFDFSSSTTEADGAPSAQSNNVTAEGIYKPLEIVTIKSNVHDSSNDVDPSAPETTGAGASVETHLPLDTVFTAAVNSDHSVSDTDPGFDVQTNACDAQLQKPLGKLPVNLVLKGHYVETDTPGAGATRLPSFEQSLVWKPVADMTLQAGLRQEQYQNFPGITNELNDALFADWSQKIIDNISWHSYAEMINSRSTVEVVQADLGRDWHGAVGDAGRDLPRQFAAGLDHGRDGDLFHGPLGQADAGHVRQPAIQQQLEPESGPGRCRPGAARFRFAQGDVLA